MECEKFEKFKKDLSGEYNVVSWSKSTNGQARVICKYGQAKNISIFNLIVGKFAVVVFVYSDHGLGETKTLGKSSCIIGCQELISPFEESVKDEANALKWLCRNPGSLISKVGYVLDSQARFIEKSEIENSNMKWDLKNVFPHVKKNYQILISRWVK